MKNYASKGKKFNNKSFKFWANVDDKLLSYEEMNQINHFWIKDGKITNGYFNYEYLEDKIKITNYVPKKSQNKKDVVAAHKRSGKKTERRIAKNDILKDLEENE